MSYYPTEFGLTNEQAGDKGSPQLLNGILSILEEIKLDDQILLIPTAETEFRMWDGLFSHRQLPHIRTMVSADPDFEHVAVAGPVQSVMFDVYRVIPSDD